MKRNFDEPILDLDGVPARPGASMEAAVKALNAIMVKLSPEQQTALGEILDKEMGKPLTLGSVCVGALMGAYDDERNLDDVQRITRMELARRIHKGGVQDIEPKDRDLVKPLIKKRYSGILVPVVAAELLEKDAIEPLKSVA